MMETEFIQMIIASAPNLLGVALWAYHAEKRANQLQKTLIDLLEDKNTKSEILP